jgi:hypothetical protein
MSVTISKSNLAKLLASEDILVEQRKTRTAYFDVKNRTLILPTFKNNLSNDLLDLFISHEVGHAIYTKVEDWARIKEEKLKSSIVNIVEDSRIERLVKQKYPGLKSIHSRAYKELMDMDFFGLKKIGIESLNLADKINLYCKVGFLPFITFNPREKEILEKVEETETFDQVIEVSKELQEYLKEELQKEMKSSSLQMDSDDEETDESYGSSGKFKDEDSEENDENEGSEENDEDEYESEDYLTDSFNENDIEDLVENGLKSLTDEYSNLNMQEMYSEDFRDSVYVDLPDINLKDYVVDYKTIFGRLKKDAPEVFRTTKECFNGFKSENASIVSYLVKEFTLKKNAQGRKKVKESKTGDINLNKIYSYKFNDDIFRRAAKVPGEKNHCMVFFVDWSASMDYYIEDTIKQLMCLVMFCKKLSIPYEVYAFTSNYWDPETKPVEFEDKVLHLPPVNLLNILSYRMSNNEFITASNILLSYAGYGFKPYPFKQNSRYDGYYIRIPQWFRLGNTPLNHAIILSNKVAGQLKEKTKTDIVNVITMSDGESHSIMFKQDGYKRKLFDHNLNVYLRDKKKKITQYIDGAVGETNSCVDFIKQFNDYRYFGFRLISQKEFKHDVYKFIKKDPYNPIHLSNFKKDNSLLVEGTSFDEFYFIKSNTINKFEEEMDIKDNETVTAIAKKFNKALSARLNNRIFLKKFIEFIS